MSTSNGSVLNGHGKEDRARREVFRVSGVWCVWLTTPLPLLAFVICIILSVTNDFVESTYATCSDISAGKVHNFLPSISASTRFTPQRYIWRILFAIHLTPRMILGFMHYNYNQGFPVTNKRSWFRRLNKLATFLHFIELSGLILVTFISSTDNYSVHEKGFMMFVGGASFYMVCVLVLFKWARHDIAWTAKDIQSYRLKMVFFMSSVICLGLCLYFFNRHMQYCEPNVYSFFALFEYLMVISNVLFHGTWYIIEFKGSYILATIPTRPGQYTNMAV